MPVLMPSVPGGHSPLKFSDEDTASQSAAYLAVGEDLKALYSQYFALVEKVYQAKIVQGETAQNLEAAHSTVKVLENKVDALCEKLGVTLSSYAEAIDFVDEK